MPARKNFVQVNVRMSEDMREQCRIAAEDEELSLVEWIRSAIHLKLEKIDKQLEYTETKLAIVKRYGNDECREHVQKLQEEVNELLKENIVLKRQIFDLLVDRLRLDPNKPKAGLLSSENISENDLDNMLENVRKLLSLPTCYEMVGERFKKEDNNDLPHDE